MDIVFVFLLQMLFAYKFQTNKVMKVSAQTITSLIFFIQSFLGHYGSSHFSSISGLLKDLHKNMMFKIFSFAAMEKL